MKEERVESWFLQSNETDDKPLPEQLIWSTTTTTKDVAELQVHSDTFFALAAPLRALLISSITQRFVDLNLGVLLAEIRLFVDGEGTIRASYSTSPGLKHVVLPRPATIGAWSRGGSGVLKFSFQSSFMYGEEYGSILISPRAAPTHLAFFVIDKKSPRRALAAIAAAGIPIDNPRFQFVQEDMSLD